MDYIIILKKVCEHFSITEKQLFSNKKGKKYIYSNARQVFYMLCLKFNIDLYNLSIKLGKHRTTVHGSVKDSKANVSNEVKLIYGSLVSCLH